MHQTLKISYEVHVSRDNVMQILKKIGPNGTEEGKWERLRRKSYYSVGSNATCYMNVFNKLKPYGFPIHGCVDGFSRRVISLKVTRSNSNPVVPALYYLETGTASTLCPTLLQTDCGAENNITAGII